jgi:Transposase DDE domain
VPSRIKELTTKLQSVLGSDQIAALAASTAFSQRKSKLSAISFLKMLLFDHLQSDSPSLQQHSFGLALNEGIQISKQAIDKRFTDNAVAFIKALFENYLQYQLGSIDLPSALRGNFRGIRIMDATSYRLPACLAEDFPGFSGDGTAACAKLQFEYELLGGTIKKLELHTVLDADKTFAANHLNSLEPGELLLRDLGYYSVDMYGKIEEAGAFYVSRLRPQVGICQLRKGLYEPLSYARIIKRLKTSGEQYLDLDVHIGKTVKKPVRLVASLLGEEAVKRRIKRKRRIKTQLNKTDRELCQLNLFITNTPPQQLAAGDIYRLYRVRWQVELVFKSWKSILKIQAVRKMDKPRFLCCLYSKLLWILLNWDVCNIVSCSLYGKQKLVSLYKCFALFRQQAQQAAKFLFGKRLPLQKYLTQLHNLLEHFCIKEARKGKEKLIDLLQIKQGNKHSKWYLYGTFTTKPSAPKQKNTDGF